MRGGGGRYWLQLREWALGEALLHDGSRARAPTLDGFRALLQAPADGPVPFTPRGAQTDRGGAVQAAASARVEVRVATRRRGRVPVSARVKGA